MFAMKVGIDIAVLASSKGSIQAGLYYYQLHLTKALTRVMPASDLYLVVTGTEGDAARKASISSGIASLVDSPVRVATVPTSFRRPYRLRRWWARRRFALNGLDVFLGLMEYDLPLPSRVTQCFLVPDLTILNAAEHHPDAHRAGIDGVYKAVKRQADLVITYSEHTRGDIATTLGIPLDRIVAIPLAAGDEFRPLPAEFVASALAPLGLTPGGYLLTVGTIEPRKNHLTLFRAFAEYLSHPGVPRLPLVIAGGGGWMNEAIYAEPAQLGIADLVKFVGRVPDLAPLYAGAAAMVYPSFYEGFGLPPLEAMACGCPVITSNATSLPEVVGDAGLTVDPKDVAGFAEAIRRVATDPALRAELSARGLARSALFTWGETARRYLEAFRVAVERKRQETAGRNS